MSRVIENDHRWDAEEIAYKHARNLHADVEENQQQFPEGSESPVPQDDSLQLDQDIYDHVVGLSVDQLKAELLKAELEPLGTEQELKATLAQHLQEERDASTHA